LEQTAPARMSGQIFISYRRDDNSAFAGRLYDRLSARLPNNHIFIDVDLEPGIDFVEEIERSVGSCEVLIAVIGKRWLRSSVGKGKRRLENPEDFVRVEIATALKRNIRVIPVLVDGASMPRSSDLPDDLKLLARRNAIEVSHNRFNADLERLLATLERPEDRAKRAKEEEGLRGIKTVIYDQRITMRDHIQQNISGGTFHGPVAAVMKDCTSIINNQPSGERKDLLETLHEQIGELISGPPDEKQQLKKMVADRLKELTEGLTSGTPDRAWYSVSSKGLLESAKFVRVFSTEIGGTLKDLGSTFWPGFTLTDVSPK
jgi:TIR domain